MTRFGERTRSGTRVNTFTQRSAASKIVLPSIDVFNTTGANTWTVPAGVTYAVVTLQGGGGSVNSFGVGTDGGDSTFAFAGGTVTAKGGKGHSDGQGTGDQSTAVSYAGLANSGDGAFQVGSATTGGAAMATRGALLRFGGAVTAGASIAINVGKGGDGAGERLGGSGFVHVEYGTLINNYRVETFKTSGTFNPPAGVTLVKATIKGGGGSATCSNDFGATDGTASSVAFTGGTITAAGGEGASTHRAGFSTVEGTVAPDNSGGGARSRSRDTGNGGRSLCVASDGVTKVVTAAVAFGTGVSVTIGAGGTNGSAGGSGYVIIEYYV